MTRRQRGTTSRLCGVAVALSLVLSLPVSAGDFYRTGNMTSPRSIHTATLLADGRVLIAGGFRMQNTDQQATAEIFDPERGTFEPTGSMHHPRWGHSAVRLADGRVLIVGGWRTSFVQATATAEIYDPDTGTFELIGSMSVARGDEPAVVPGCSGDWLVIGGTAEGNFGTATSRVDRFDPVTETFTHIADLVRSRRDHAVAKLADGRLLVVGGQYSCCNTNENNLRRFSAEILSACGGGATLLTSSLVHPRSRLPQAVLLANGKVLIGGGGGEPPFVPELFDPQGEDFQASTVPYLLGGRPRLTPLLDGKALISGLDELGAFAGAVYDPATDQAERVGQGLALPNGHTAVRLADGRVLLAGGFDFSTGVLTQALIYDPAYSPGAFLSRFPIESEPGGPAVAAVTSVLDHHLPRAGVPDTWRFPYTCWSSCNSEPDRCADDDGIRQVLAFEGSLGDAQWGENAAPPGYRRGCDGSAFAFAAFDYLGAGGGGIGTCGGGATTAPSYLDYDGHPGYDFGYPLGVGIVAAADGWLERPATDPVNSPCSGSGSNYNQLRIRHDNGLETWYLHAIEGSECTAVPALCQPEGGPVFVTAGQRIAQVGSTGIDPPAPHLHFEVRRSADQQIVDPFGCAAAVEAVDPAACLPGGSLWRQLFFDGFESGDLGRWPVVVPAPPVP
ncbi:MAG TPA: peptidoglycan DD-metalloendopeptidase family protein [Thermoanaerobaculia bacterium]|nr:peptidoglycan DD-metalloendopeptidase family protein [Thermoanaerobaculia bacterium]